MSTVYTHHTRDILQCIPPLVTASLTADYYSSNRMEIQCVVPRPHHLDNLDHPAVNQLQIVWKQVVQLNIIGERIWSFIWNLIGILMKLIDNQYLIQRQFRTSHVQYFFSFVGSQSYPFVYSFVLFIFNLPSSFCFFFLAYGVGLATNVSLMELIARGS
jgi:hypothetical protein